jgi:phosphatidylglycerol:prolipoprotein diacylglycerol transferase
MFPNLFTIGPFTLHTYGLLVAIGFLSGILITVRIAKSRGINPQHVMDMGFFIIISAIVGSRLLYVLINFSYYIENPLDVFKIWQGGLVFSGGLIGVVLVSALYVRKQNITLWQMADLWSPAIALGQAIGRMGCLMAGCCYGKPTSSELGIVFTDPHSLAPINIPLQPTQIYSSISGFVIFGILLALQSKRKFNGQVFLWFLIMHSTARLFIERLRGDDRGILLGGDMSVTQLTTLIILFASIIGLNILRKKNEKQVSRPGETKEK